jgi:hypothetical protein
MGRLTMSAGNSFGSWVTRLVWSACQNFVALSRRLDVWRWLMLGAVCLLAGMAVTLERQQQQAQSWETHYQSTQHANTQGIAPADVSDVPDDGRHRLRAFEQLLLPHPDIPQAVQNVLGTAEDAGLSIRSAEYRVQAEDRGGFMRYRINLPVQGTAEAVNQYIYAILLNQKNLALEGVQLKRENMDSPDLEARIQWVLLTRLPSVPDAPDAPEARP